MSGAGWRGVAGRVLLAGAGAVTARALLAAWRRTARREAPAWQRTNFRGEPVSLAGGPALAVSAGMAAAAGAGGAAGAAAALTAAAGAGGFGLYDDLVGLRPGQRVAKGFHGHLAALRRGQVTSGTVKLAGIAAVSLVAAALLDRDLRRPSADSSGSWSAHATRGATRPQNSMINARGRSGGEWVERAAGVVLGAGVIAGAANLVNLLDLRPGRALKVGLLAGVPLSTGPTGGLAAGPVGACAAMLPEDLDESTMLGDGGANALGALLGVALAARTGPAGRAVALAAIAALTAASEKVSFTQVIAATPVLRDIDNLGRRPDPTAEPD